MNLEIEGIVQRLCRINKNFGNGAIVNKSSLEFAISAAYKSKDSLEQLAYIVRAILCDHVFADGNKRTAANYIMAALEDFKYKYDPFKVDRFVLKIAKNNITKVKTIRRMIKNAASKNF